jgi:hypothetical protein
MSELDFKEPEHVRKATEQLQTLILATDYAALKAHSKEEWRKLSALWLLIKAGVYVPFPGKFYGWLKLSETRIECEKYAKRWRLSIDDAAEIWDAETTLELVRAQGCRSQSS